MEQESAKTAFGHSGIDLQWVSNRTGGAGAALSPKSHVWLMISHGILNEVCQT